MNNKKDSYCTDGQLEVMVYKNDENMRGFRANGLMKNIAVHYIDVIFIDCTVKPNKVRKFTVFDTNKVQEIK